MMAIEIAIPQNILKLMIVAHPDDETFFYGAHLSSGGWLVVCVTYNANQERGKEFFSVMNETGNIGIMLDYPDLYQGRRVDWTRYKGKIARDIKEIFDRKDWARVVTHNPDGEYGHTHHQIVNQIVTRIAKDGGKDDRLFYFGPYFEAGNLDSTPLIPMDEDTLKRKCLLINFYRSQRVSIHALGHSFPYEYIVPSFLWKRSLADNFFLAKKKLLCNNLRKKLSEIKASICQ